MRLLTSLTLALSLTFAAYAAAPIQTTLESAIRADDGQIVLASATGLMKGDEIYIDAEAMRVSTVAGRIVQVFRGVDGTRATAHSAAAAVRYGRPSLFVAQAPAGACASADTLLHVVTGNTWTCTSGNWTIAGASGGGGGEPALGNPAADGYILSSTAAGVRSWIANTGGGGGAGAFAELADCKVTVVGQVVTLASGCKVQTSGAEQPVTVGATATVTQSAGDGTVWVGFDSGTFKAWHNVTATCGAGLTCVGATSLPPAGARLLGHINFTANVGTVVDDRTPFVQGTPNFTGVGVTDTTVSGVRTVDVVPAFRGIRTVSGTTDTLADTDCYGMVAYSNAGAIAVTIPDAGTSGQFLAGCKIAIAVTGGGTATITRTSSSTINGGTSLAVTGAATIGSNGTNYFAQNSGTGGGGGSSAGTQTFTASGTWTVPTGITRVFVQAWSGGQAGQRGYYGSGFGGNGGGYTDRWCTVTPGASIPYVVGAGGTGTAANGNKASGGDTKFPDDGSCIWLLGATEMDGTVNTGPGRDKLIDTRALFAYRNTSGDVKALATALAATTWNISPVSNGVGGGAAEPVSSGNPGVAGAFAYTGGAGGGSGANDGSAVPRAGGVAGSSRYCTAGAGGAITGGGGQPGGNGSAPGCGGGGGAWDGSNTTAGGNGARGEIRIYY